MTQVVEGVCRSISDDSTHLHITHVRTRKGEVWTLTEVASSIRAGEPWLFSNDEYIVSIRVVSRCRAPRCAHGPYLQTAPESSNGDNLENAPESFRHV